MMRAQRTTGSSSTPRVAPMIATLAMLAVSLALSTAAAAADRRELEAFANETLSKLYAESPAAKELAAQARAVIVFPRVWKGGIGLGGEIGEGVLRIGGRSVDYYRLTGASFGIQFGVQRKAVVVMFMDADSLAKFRSSQGWKAGVDGSIAIATFGAGTSLDTNTARKPIIGFVVSNKGLMYNLSLEGTKLTRLEN